ncbi:hypothetical protein [Kitasatospora mediocidica]|uniref:hypothetical protein n=1 Tax=Kitasatospora mediocidica TaxID=58352 RepID=UPI00055B940C|nr:hypothetical protein [Kitasatospora mediocidica]
MLHDQIDRPQPRSSPEILVRSDDDRRFGWRLPDNPSALRDLHAELRRTVARWRAAPAGLEIAALAVVEPAGRCLRRTGASRDVFVSRQDQPRLDGGRDGPTALVMAASHDPGRTDAPFDDARAGHDLPLVRTHARDWGRHRSATGTTYWAQLVLPGQQA